MSDTTRPELFIFRFLKGLAWNGYGPAPGLSSATWAVLCAMAAHADGETGVGIFPGEEKLADETGLGVRTVRDCINKLKEHDIVYVVAKANPRKGLATEYGLRIITERYDGPKRVVGRGGATSPEAVKERAKADEAMLASRKPIVGMKDTTTSHDLGEDFVVDKVTGEIIDVSGAPGFDDDEDEPPALQLRIVKGGPMPDPIPGEEGRWECGDLGDEPTWLWVQSTGYVSTYEPPTTVKPEIDPRELRIDKARHDRMLRDEGYTHC